MRTLSCSLIALLALWGGSASGQTLAVSHLGAEFAWTIPAHTAENAPTSHVVTCGAAVVTVPMPANSVPVRNVVAGPGSYTCTLYAQNAAGRQTAPDVPFPVFQSGYTPGLPIQLQVLADPGGPPDPPEPPIMAQPTLSDYQESDYSDTATNEVSASITWSAGDVIVVLGMTENNTRDMGLPTATGLTFAAVAGTPTNTANSCKGYAWTATAGSSGSGAVTSVKSHPVSAGGLSVFVFSGSDGLGGTSISAALGSTTTQSLTRTGTNSHVVQIWGDWNAVNDTTVTWTPSGQTQREATFVSGAATFFAASWGDQGASGATSYGFSGFAGGDMTAITLEVLGTTGGGSTSLPPQPSPMAHLLVR